jgi:plastocyanin
MSAKSHVLRAVLAPLGAAITIGLAGVASAQSAALKPVYIHENGANDFLESIVAARPGQPIEFVNEDTGSHTVIGYLPYKAGALIKRFKGILAGTKGPGHKISTYRITFAKPGVYAYYCSIHAHLATVYDHGAHHYTAAVPRPKIHGYGGPMAGVIIVSNDPRVLAITPPTAHQKVLPDYFGG